MLDIRPYPDFCAASHAVLDYLHAQLNFGLWMVTRTAGDDWIVLQALDHGYGVKEGNVFRWGDSFCSQMVLGRGPSIAPRSREIPAYAAAPIGLQVPIAAYIGVPLMRQDGSLFGTLCAIDPVAQRASITAELPLVHLLGRLLCNVLEADLKLEEQARSTERVQAEKLSDAKTGLYNRQGWDLLLAAEENRCRRYGHPACVLSIGLHGSHSNLAIRNELISQAAQAVKRAARDQDVVAHVGDNTLALLGVESNASQMEPLREKVAAALTAAKVDASVGIAVRNPRFDLVRAWRDAETGLSTAKKSRLTSRSK